jgi:anti-sigma B factor antagonist
MQLVESNNEKGVTVLTPSVRRLDASVAPAFKQQAVAAVGSGSAGLVVDLSTVEFMDSSGLGAMVSILKALGARGSMAVCNAGPAVAALFKLTRMDKVFAIAGSRAEALERVAGR